MGKDWNKGREDVRQNRGPANTNNIGWQRRQDYYGGRGSGTRASNPPPPPPPPLPKKR